MTEKGLLFAAAPLGEEARYTSLHRALVTYVWGLPIDGLVNR